MGTPLLWIGFNVIRADCVALDLGVFSRRLHKVELREAFWSTTLWIAMSVLFGLGIWHFSGYQRAIEYFTGYLIEKALSVDNLFLFLVIFRTFAIDERFQHRMLEWGILGALVMRGIMIFAGSGTDREVFVGDVLSSARFWFMPGIHMLFAKKEKIQPEESAFFRFASQASATDTRLSRRAFFRDVRTGRLFATPLFLVLLVVEDHGHDAGDRFDSGHFRDHARSFHRLHVERVRDSGIARDVFPAGGILESTAISDDGACVCAGVYRREDDRGTLVTHPGAHFAVDRGRNLAARACGVPAVSPSTRRSETRRLPSEACLPRAGFRSKLYSSSNISSST